VVNCSHTVLFILGRSSFTGIAVFEADQNVGDVADLEFIEVVFDIL
jgi:hypothetical protein